MKSPVQDTIFPIIARAIERLHRDSAKFVSRNEITKLLLRDPESRAIIERVYEQRERRKSIQQYAGNMVDWFSQRWTVGEPKWLWLLQKFERSEKKIDGCWAYKPFGLSAIVVFPDEVEEEIKELPEGAVIERRVNAYERNPLARQLCVEKYGARCYICGFSFGETYGAAVDGFIHVHHLRQLSKIGRAYKVDPIIDLRPVCPNCHAVIHHRRNSPYGIEDVQVMLRKAGLRSAVRTGQGGTRYSAQSRTRPE